MLRSLTMVALAAVGTACAAASQSPPTRVVDREAGFTLALPHTWRMVVDPANGPDVAVLSTYPVSRLGDVGETPPPGQTWLLLHDDGPIWALPPWGRRIRPLPSRLPAEESREGFGPARMLQFRLGGNAFTAYAKGAPRDREVLSVLASIRITPFGRSLALTTSRRTVDGVREWRVGNPRSRRRLLVVGCPGAEPCPGLAVTQRLVNGVTPLAADVWVIQLLRGREDLLERLARRLRPEVTIRVGAAGDAEATTRRIVALARQ